MPLEFVITGLGNPGSRYEKTRHNLGFRVVEAIAAARRGRWGDPARKCRTASVRQGGGHGLLVEPLTYMNLSGDALAPIVIEHELPPSRLLVVCDDIALPLGKLRIRQKGSAGGHNGVKSVVSACGSDEFLRVRVGILPDRPVAQMRDFVLSRVAKADAKLLGHAEVAGADAVEALVTDGPEKAMAAFNSLDLREAKED